MRTAVNALCDFVGAGVCSGHPYAGSSLDETSVRGQPVRATDFADLATRTSSMLFSLGISSSFHSPSIHDPIVRTDLDPMRTAVR
jgi:hypothetical protein